MSKQKFDISPFLLEASDIVEAFEDSQKPQSKPKRKNTIEAFTKTPSQHHSNGIPTVSQHHQKKIILSEKQSIVYDFLIQNQNKGIFNKPFIEKNTGVSYGTISDIIRKFKKLNILSITYNKFAKVYYYKINENIKINKFDFKFKINATSPQYESNGIPTGFQYHSNSIPIPSLYNNSCIKNINKTNDIINLILSENFEMGYWRQKKLTAKQIIKWMEIAKCNIDNIIQYLCYCRFEMVDLDLEKSKPIENVFNWFFRILEKTGGYPKPKGYKSFQEKKIEVERQIVKQKEKEAQEIRELHQRKIKAEQDKKFWNMMNDPEGELFKKCFEKINSFQKRKPTGKGFEISMRSIFDKMTLET